MRRTAPAAWSPQFSNQMDQYFQVFWAGARYSFTRSLDVAVAYCHYWQNNAAGGADGLRHEP